MITVKLQSWKDCKEQVVEELEVGGDKTKNVF